MLSYRHSFHAGNFADVLKHSVLIEILSYMTRKDGALEYIDTHAGAGIYDVTTENMVKLGEYRQGIAKLIESPQLEWAAYLQAVAKLNQKADASSSDNVPAGVLTGDSLQRHFQYYPGSPLIALQYLRPQDRAWLYELHPQDVKKLEQCVHRGTQGNTRLRKKIRVLQADGYKGLISHMPPTSRRALVLVDPSYELKSDYEEVVRTVAAAYKKFPAGVYAIWYPVVERRYIDHLDKMLVRSGMKNIQRFELGVGPDTDAKGMTASGMVVINPPWQLRDTMKALLPELAHTLTGQNTEWWRCDTLVGE